MHEFPFPGPSLIPFLGDFFELCRMARASLRSSILSVLSHLLCTVLPFPFGLDGSLSGNKDQRFTSEEAGDKKGSTEDEDEHTYQGSGYTDQANF
jgi:hypothetical protein